MTIAKSEEQVRNQSSLETAVMHSTSVALFRYTSELAKPPQSPEGQKKR